MATEAGDELTMSEINVNKIMDRSGANALLKNLFVKDASDVVAWTKTGNGTAETQTGLTLEVSDKILYLASGTSISMPTTLNAGTDYAIWVAPDGTLEADASFTVAPTTGGRRIGGFHYAPGGNASIDSTGDWSNHTGGNTTPQINEYSFYDLKWRPSVADPRGLTLVNDSFWAGIYLMQNGNEAGPLHMYDVNPCRDGNDPYKPYATTPTRYSDATPLNIFEVLRYNGFRPPNVDEFQLLAIGTTEANNIGGSGPGNTGDMSDARDKETQTSAWGVMDATGVLSVWGFDSLPSTSDTAGAIQGRGTSIFRISRFTFFGGSWDASWSGSRGVTSADSDASRSSDGGRGVCDHVILD